MLMMNALSAETMPNKLKMANLHELTSVFLGISDQCALSWNNVVNVGSTPC